MPLTKPRRSQPVLVDEVIVEILSWLPVKSLLRFRCVCKSWKSLISHPHFVKLHLHKSLSLKTPNLILTLKSTLPWIFQSRVLTCSLHSFLKNPSSAVEAQDGHHHLLNCKYEILGSCNGLVCLLYSAYDGPSEEYWFRFWNPATRLKSKKSLCLRVNFRRSLVSSPAKFGFGYDKSNDTYKVVAVLNGLYDVVDSKGIQVKAYTMGDHCWRDIQRFPACPVMFQKVGKYLSGTLNWLAIRNAASDYEWHEVAIDQLVIVSLDLGKETCKQFLLPVGLDEIPLFEPTIGAFGDCLYLFHDYKRTHFVVWQMKEFGVEKSWTQFVNVSYQHLQIGGPFQILSLVPFCISENGDVILLRNENSFEIILYNQRDNRLECASEIRDKEVDIDAMDYVQSLILPC